MIYHILNDEKFTDWVINSFKNFNNQQFILVSNKGVSKHFSDSCVKFVSKEYFLYNFIPNGDDILVFYFLHLHTISFLNKRKNLKCKKIWIGYGADYYYYLLNSRVFHSLYLKKTKKCFNTFKGHHFIKRTALTIYQILFFHIKVLPAIKTLTYFAPILPNEFSLVKRKFHSFKFDYIDFTFGDIDFLGTTDKTINGNDILLGNSATFACNHIDILDLLMKLKISNSINIPLSYGNTKYQEFLNEIIPRDFNELNINLLNKFLPLNEYNQILDKCGFAIMPHLRQQGMGNIYSLLYSGTKLFLFKKNPVYQFLKQLGVCFYSIEDLATNSQLLTFPLSEHEVKCNRKVIANYYSKNKSLNRIKKIINL